MDLLFQRAFFHHSPSWLCGAAAGGSIQQLQPRNLVARLHHSRSMRGKENKESRRSHTWTGGKGSKCRYCSAYQDLPLGPRLFTPRMAGLAADGTVTSHFPGTVLGHSCRAVTLPPCLWRYSSFTILPIWGNLEGMSQSCSFLRTQPRPFWWLYRGANSKSVHFCSPPSLLQVLGSQFSLQ